MFNINLENKEDSIELNNTVTEIKNSLEGINSRLNLVEQISDLEYIAVDITAVKKEKKREKNEKK